MFFDSFHKLRALSVKRKPSCCIEHVNFFFLLDIFLKSFPVLPGELKDKLFILNKDDGGLSDEHIMSLKRYGLMSAKH